METKQNIRNYIFQKRKDASLKELETASHQICQKVISLLEFQKAEIIYTYIDFNREVATKEIVEAAWTAGKRVAAPRVEEKNLFFYEITSYDQLKPGYFGISEPDQCSPVNEEHALMIVPGVAFDCKRHRVGYGQGFYDRYLSKHKNHTTVAIAFDFQIVDSVPYEEFDIFPETLITQSHIF